MTKLALARYNENITQLLTDNGNGTSSAKQVELCTLLPHQPRHRRRTTAARRTCRPRSTRSTTIWLPKTLDNGVWAVAGGRHLRDDQLPQQQDDDEHRGDRLLVERQHDDEHDGLHHVPRGHHERGQSRRV